MIDTINAMVTNKSSVFFSLRSQAELTVQLDELNGVINLQVSVGFPVQIGSSTRRSGALRQRQAADSSK